MSPTMKTIEKERIRLVQIRSIVLFSVTLGLIFFGITPAFSADSKNRKDHSVVSGSKVNQNTGSPLDNPFGNYLAGRFAKSSSDFIAAAHFLSKAVANNANDKILQRHILFSLIASGNIPAAQNLLKKEDKFDRTSSIALLALFVSAIQSGQYDIALARLEAMPNDRINNLIVPLLRAWLFVGMEKYQKAPMSSSR